MEETFWTILSKQPSILQMSFYIIIEFILLFIFLNLHRLIKKVLSKRVKVSKEGVEIKDAPQKRRVSDK